MDTLFKWLTSDFAVLQLVWARFFFSALTVIVAIRLIAGRLPWRSRAPHLQVLRSLLLMGCTFCFSSALARIPLADTTAVNFASPLITVALAALWLGEAVGRRRWGGVLLGFVGVMVAVRPPFLTGAPLDWAYLLPLGSAALFAGYNILTRKLAAIDDPRTTILHTGLAASLVTSLMQPLAWHWPSGTEWALLAAIGSLGALSHGLLVLAYARAPASLLAPLSYTQLVWATLAGWWVFGDAPDGWTLAGAAIIACGGILAVLPQRPMPASSLAHRGGGH
ncbi:MAG: DMT family transporter [Acetobacteraceae bacterium]|nr:DMT family transporter [Acetobacteraceae bacterium]